MLDLLIPFLRALSVGFAVLFVLLSAAAVRASEKADNDATRAAMFGFLLFFNVGFVVSCAGLYATWGL